MLAARDNGTDVDVWTMDDLRDTVEEFVRIQNDKFGIVSFIILYQYPNLFSVWLSMKNHQNFWIIFSQN